MISIANNEPEAAAKPETSPVADTLEAAKTFIAVEGARVCARAVGYQARAIILTGSLSRGEATLKRDGMGWRALGDATFLVIHPRPAALNTANIAAQVEEFLASNGIICKIAVVASTASDLTSMKPHIYAFELKERGIIVWGDQSARDLMPRFTAADIPIEDGWWFLCNRIIEQLDSAAKAKDNADDDVRVNYRIAKLYLSMAACYLLAIGQYEPSYQDRARRLRELAASSAPPASPIPLQRFASLVSECTELKVQGHASGAFANFPEWRDATSDAEAIWRWTLARILGVSPDSSRSELLARMGKRQPWFSWAKGWLRAAVLHSSDLRKDPLRWARLARMGSPRYLVYGAASHLFFFPGNPGAITSSELAAIADTLPLNPHLDNRSLTWRDVAAIISRNFHSFVASTRS